MTLTGPMIHFQNVSKEYENLTHCMISPSRSRRERWYF